MSQYKEDNLDELDFLMKLSLSGHPRKLRWGKVLPIVFLFDENHDNLNRCIDKNIENAKILIEFCDVSIVGVESLTGGKSWDSQNQVYSENYSEKKLDDHYSKIYKSGQTKFADELSRYFNDRIFGVESYGMQEKLHSDIVLPENEYYNTPVANHPLNAARSEHFIRTLFEYYGHQESGNLILNCGSNHNNDIEKWIENGKIDEITSPYRANYIRFDTVCN